MEKPERNPRSPRTETHYLHAAAIVTSWMQEYKRYLLDGDPNILHPKANAALTAAITHALVQTAETRRTKKKEDADGG